MRRVSIVIPAYNEEGVIPELAARLGDVMDRLDGDAEAILVAKDRKGLSGGKRNGLDVGESSPPLAVAVVGGSNRHGHGNRR